ncbi:MAG: MSHA biogenesis protein MshK [Paraglaciecola sp.]|jgi:MSHA biogenesis protein MshK
MIKLSGLLFLTLLSTLCVGQVLVDPTRPSISNSRIIVKGEDPASYGAKPLQVSAIFINGQNKHAIINGISYKEGQSMHGFELISIAKNMITVRNTDGQKTFFVTNSFTLKKDTTNDF